MLVGRGVDALGDVFRLLVQADVDLGMAPVEARLLVADVAHGIAGQRLDAAQHLARPPDLAGDDDEVGRRHVSQATRASTSAGEIGIDDGIGDAVGWPSETDSLVNR